MYKFVLAASEVVGLLAVFFAAAAWTGTLSDSLNKLTLLFAMVAVVATGCFVWSWRRWR